MKEDLKVGDVVAFLWGVSEVRVPLEAWGNYPGANTWVVTSSNSPGVSRRLVPPAGPHGGDSRRVARALGVPVEEILDLSQSLNPFAPDVGAIVQRHLDEAGRYPDPEEATARLAEVLGVGPERLLITNGGSEAIHLVASVVGGSVRSEPEFRLHPRGSAGPVWRSDPHSPSGRLAGPDEHADVWDEAFYPLATGHWTSGRSGTIVGSLTKTFACPGLRLGYVLADPDLISDLATRQPHWSVGTLALAVLVDLLEVADLPEWSDQIATSRNELVRILEQLNLVVDAQHGPWVLVDSPGLRERLAPHGVLVRDCTSFGMSGWVRIAVPDDDGLDRLASALELAPPDGSGSPSSLRRLPT